MKKYTMEDLRKLEAEYEDVQNGEEYEDYFDTVGEFLDWIEDKKK